MKAFAVQAILLCLALCGPTKMWAALVGDETADPAHDIAPIAPPHLT